jgi:hypothetical protein
LTGFDGRKTFKFIIPCISNCVVELFTGQHDDGNGKGSFCVNDIDVIGVSENSTICYLDSPYNPSYFYKVNPQSHKMRNPHGKAGRKANSGTIGGLGDARPYSYSLVRDCILNFDRLYNNDDYSANKR